MKKTLQILLVILFVSLLTSCFTTVSVNSLKPSEVNLGGSQVIAVSSTEPFSSYNYYKTIPVYVDDGVPVPKEIKGIGSTENYNTDQVLAKYTSDAVFNALSDGVYQIIAPATTDSYLKSVNRFNSQAEVLKSKGITMLFESSIDSMNLEEYISGHAQKNKEGKTYYVYSLVQDVNVSFSYRLTDLKTGRVVDAHAYSGKYPIFGFDKETTIGKLDENGKFSFEPFISVDAEDLYKKAIDSFTTQIRDRLIPHNIRLNFSLMDTKDKSYAEVNKLVDEGFINIAFDQYADIYDRTKDIVAGYNLAILYYAMGEPEKAIDFAQNLYSKTLNADMGKLLQKMQNYYSQDQAAKSQVGLPKK